MANDVRAGEGAGEMGTQGVITGLDSGSPLLTTVY